MENLTAFLQFLHKLPPPPWNPHTRFLTSFISTPNPIPTGDPTQPTSLLSENRFLNSLPRRLFRIGSCPLRRAACLLQEDGDWSKDRLFAVTPQD
ncbi:hypothetical protein DY000_02017025 [Brassica cretica]|uniref:Uncharacterized protein n=1 Tax=Brassica cretica TaxID=69181 RepID=A0ABQ7CU64_BRACR|nr:hypothetical protein DY000_02017025 [Brassica cretica]